MNNCEVIDPGLTNYKEARDLQKKIVQERLCKKIPDTLILCEHYPVITLGRKGKRKDLLVSEEFLNKNGIEIYPVERGGEATYHGPGQLVGYPIFDLRYHGMDLHKFLRKIEEVIIRTLSEIGIESCRRKGWTGVWIYRNNEFEKIAFIGIGVSKWVTFHGFSLNVNCDLTPFSWIVPCGLKGAHVASVKKVMSLVEHCSVREIKPKIIKNFRKVFDFDYEKKITRVA
ncbi:lipoyl(octanoyl) transferase [Candidatus Desantisbacteria bacterium CG1_02_38_46]|uniref:Octanoyltransferase n=3 Tax=unclassified Candidatus Desantisiibacteriota TaxID=3106372 RepID=A0A2H9P9C1_9BACT|nr:MAG: lipoyl(octanoyl) transferase [Candidatus Desantisbacteria bacterium CG1_02_38_46]PIU51167.1 MAG: lipoyl(octanoyl) transferase [Candidatus Desantisbacteria bacterium CG07_land_8_20_14_0_80_39_15]PIZ14764.1 MAG: lipoyl(octanoyl) transferase [Candidatus Desantisbacteria bacterium CG_4_10_14_0_8_um_filter_39_17]